MADTATLTARQRSFLAAYSRVATVSAAAKVARIGRCRHYEWLKEPEYKQAFAEAEEEAIEHLEAEVHQRAMYGTAEPVIWRGKICFEPQRDPETGQVKRDRKGQPLMSTTPLTIRRPSDQLLMFLLKSKKPQVYREHVKVAAAATAPQRITVEYVESDGNGGRG